MKVEEPDLAGTYTYADYLTWWWDERVELIKGKIYKMSPAPNTTHQRVVLELSRQISNYLKRKECQVFIAPFDVRLPNSKRKGNQYIDTVVQPDICVICDPSKIDEAGCLGAPDWIIEILSPHTSAKDLSKKYDVYEQSKVKEYWVIHPMEGTVLIFILNMKGKYESRSKPYIRTDKLTPVMLPGLVINLEEVFPEGI
jgi:Uma2 family endonuclease